MQLGNVGSVEHDSIRHFIVGTKMEDGRCEYSTRFERIGKINLSVGSTIDYGDGIIQSISAFDGGYAVVTHEGELVIISFNNK